MNVRIPFAAVALAAGAAIAPVAQAQIVDPCIVHTCMAGISGFGASGGAACAPATDFFFDSLVVWDWSGFDMPATWALRYMYMGYCPGVATAPANVAIAAEIADVWYAVP